MFVNNRSKQCKGGDASPINKLFLITTNLGKLISSIEPKAQWHLDPNVFNCSQHILIRDQMTPCAASIWRPARVDINLILVISFKDNIFSPQKNTFYTWQEILHKTTTVMGASTCERKYLMMLERSSRRTRVA